MIFIYRNLGKKCEMSSTGLSDRLLLVDEERYEDEATYPQSYQNSPAYPSGMLTFKTKCDPGKCD